MRAVLLASALLALPFLANSAEAADRVIEIQAGTNPDGSMYLRPDKVSVLPNDRVTIRVTNVDSIFHDVAILGYGGRDIEIEVPGHQTQEQTFVADTKGEFRLVCEVTGHKQKGMQGTFTVADAKTPGSEVVPLVVLVALLAIAARRRR